MSTQNEIDETKYTNLTNHWKSRGSVPEMEPYKWRHELLNDKHQLKCDLEFLFIPKTSPQAEIWGNSFTAGMYKARLDYCLQQHPQTLTKL